MNTEADESFELSELCEQAGVTPRTVRYYVQQGLLPAPGMGPGTKYGREHLDRLLLIRRLQREHLPLAEIRKHLARLDDAQVAAALHATSGEKETDALVVESTGQPYGSRESVADYVAGVLHEPRSSASHLAMSVSASRSEPRPVSYERDRWDRYRLADDVEIHVRRPLSRETNRRVEKLLKAARNILGEEP